MAKQTVNLGTIPNSGLDGDDARTAFTKVNENFSELYNAMGGAGGTVSPKLTAVANSVWAANQLLMASGANTLAMLTTGATGRALIGAANAAAGRTTLGLGTAAIANVTTSTTDVTPGSVLRVGDSGLGAVSAVVVNDANANLPTGMFLLNTVANGGLNGPVMDTFVGAWALANYSANATSGFQLASPQTGVSTNKGRLFARQVFSGTWSAWTELTTASTLDNLGWGPNARSGYLNNIPAGTDLNTLIEPGAKAQQLNANATLALNYPATQAGTLLIQSAGANITTQKYINYNSGVEWTRSRYNDVWSPWKKSTNVEDTGFGADQSGTSGKYVMLPATPNNVAPTSIIAARTADDQAVSQQPVAGEDFAGIHISRELRPVQFGVSGRGGSAKFYFRGYAAATANPAEWQRLVDVAYLNSFGIGSFSVRITDANSPTVTGIYRLAGTDANVPETISGCSLWHNQQTTTIAAQIAIVTTNGNVWTRTNNSGTWTAWQRSVNASELAALARGTVLTGYAVGSNAAIVATDTLLSALGKIQGQLNATIPISKGGSGATTAAGARTNLGLGSAAVADAVGVVASGAILESSANANGYFTKYADGTMVCTGSFTMPAGAINTQAGVTATYASNFVSTPIVTYSPLAATGTGSQADIGLNMYNGLYIAPNATNCAFNSYRYRTQTDNPVIFNYLAIGRWKV